eukprot:1181882-Prorocentrum_minimum.AAC.2
MEKGRAKMVVGLFSGWGRGAALHKSRAQPTLVLCLPDSTVAKVAPQAKDGFLEILVKGVGVVGAAVPG